MLVFIFIPISTPESILICIGAFVAAVFLYAWSEPAA
jgi:hypothetical protein